MAVLKAPYDQQIAPLLTQVTPDLEDENYSDAIQHCITFLEDNPEIDHVQIVFSEVTLQSHDAIMTRFYDILESPEKLSLLSIEQMFARLVHVSDLKFPFALASIAKQSDEFSHQELQVLVTSALKRIANHYIYTPECAAAFKIALEVAESRGIINRHTKLTLDGYAENTRVFQDSRFKNLVQKVDVLSKSIQVLWIEVQQNRRLINRNREGINVVARRLMTVESHMQALNDRVNENAKILQSELNQLKQALRDHAKRQKKVGIVNAVLTFIPVLGPILGKGGEFMMDSWGALVDLTDTRAIGASVLGLGEPILDRLEGDGASDFLKNNQAEILTNVANYLVSEIVDSTIESDELIMARAELHVVANTESYDANPGLRLLDSSSKHRVPDYHYSPAGPSGPQQVELVTPSSERVSKRADSLSTSIAKRVVYGLIMQGHYPLEQKKALVTKFSRDIEMSARFIDRRKHLNTVRSQRAFANDLIASHQAPSKSASEDHRLAEILISRIHHALTNSGRMLGVGQPTDQHRREWVGQLLGLEEFQSRLNFLKSVESQKAFVHRFLEYITEEVPSGELVIEDFMWEDILDSYTANHHLQDASLSQSDVRSISARAGLFTASNDSLRAQATGLRFQH